MTSRSFKPSSLSIRPRRPSTACSSSASSTKSQDCPSPLSTSYPAPITPDSPSYGVARGSPVDTPRVARSRPIAIELPSRKRSGQIYTPTPPEALSARGDKLGGYFPFHEEITQSYKSHPFHNKSSSVKPSFDQGAITPDSRSPVQSPGGNRMPESMQLPQGLRATTPVDPLPTSVSVGKYHPSNYKKVKVPEKLVAANSAAANPPHHSRKKSDIKKKLQQYQRDMVQQAAIAGHIQLPDQKPISPRLIPLSSPGPVTPMELEEEDGYLAAGYKTGTSLINEVAKDMSRL